MTYVAYSIASMNALASGATAADALINANTAHDMIVVAEIDTDQPLRELDTLPRDARIIWRGSNELAKRFRA